MFIRACLLSCPAGGRDGRIADGVEFLFLIEIEIEIEIGIGIGIESNEAQLN
jgi:hypothetical protein